MGIMEKKMEATLMGYIGYRIWGIVGAKALGSGFRI